MQNMTIRWIAVLLAVTLLAGLTGGCTHYNPNTGQQEIDYGATAGVAGAAMGAAALGVALSNNNDERYYYGGPGYYGGGGRAYQGGNRGHNTVNVNRSVNVDQTKVHANRTQNRGTRIDASRRNNVAARAHSRPNAGNRPRRQR